jgi:hypothetical protein
MVMLLTLIIRILVPGFDPGCRTCGAARLAPRRPVQPALKRLWSAKVQAAPKKLLTAACLFSHKCAIWRREAAAQVFPQVSK